MSIVRGFASVVVCSSLVLGCHDQGPNPPGPPANIVVTSGDAQQATVATALAEPILVKVTDATNRAVPGARVTFAPAQGDGDVAPSQTTTDANGVARTAWTLGRVAGDTKTLEVSVERGEAIAPLITTVHAKAVPAAVAALSIVDEPATAALSGAPLAIQPVLRLVDRFGNDVPQAKVVVAVAVVGDSLSHILGGTISVLTDEVGRATFMGLRIYGGPDNVRLVFSAPSVPPISSSLIDLLPATGT